MKNERPSCSWMKIMLYKVTSRFTAKFLAGHYVIEADGKKAAGVLSLRTEWIVLEKIVEQE